MLYLIEDRDYLKIGYSTDIESRIKSYKTTNVYCKLIDIKDGERWNELELHKLCSEYHYTGEWFKNCPEVLEIWNSYNPHNQYDYKGLLELMKEFSNLWNFNITPQSYTNKKSFVDLYKNNINLIDDTLKRNTPFFNFVKPYMKEILNNYTKLKTDKVYWDDYMKAIQSSVRCLLDFNIIESKIKEQMNDDFKVKEEN